MKNHLQKLRFVISGLYVSSVLNLAIAVYAKASALLIGVILARVLGPKEYGLYTMAIAVSALLAIPAQLGNPTLQVRLIAAYENKQQWSLIKGLLRWCDTSVVLTTCVLWGTVIYLTKQAGFGKFSITDTTFLIALLIVPMIALIAQASASLRGFGYVSIAQIPDQAIRPTLLILLVVIALLVSGSSLSAMDALKYTALSYALAWVVNKSMLHALRPRQVSRSNAEYQVLTWFKSSLPYMITSSSAVVIAQTDVLMLGFLASPRDAGTYRVATQLSSLAAFILTVVNGVSSPRFARLYVEQNMSAMQKLAGQTALLSLCASVPITLLLISTGMFLINKLFGEGYMGAYVPMIILLIGQLVNCAIGSVALILNMSGFAWYATLGLLVGGASNVALNALLIPMNGAMGAAFATCLSVMLWNVLLMYWVIRKLKLNPTVTAVFASYEKN